MSHFGNLERHIPDLRSRRILDLGSGKGDFLIDAATHGTRATGIELNRAYIEEARSKARAAGYDDLEIVAGAGETLPFPDASFGFVNLSEVIEHVAEPVSVLRETWRVLVPGGAAYVSVPSRFGLRDPHYHLYFVNWLPRAWADGFVRLFGKEKHDAGEAGHQRLADMHYYTYRAFTRVARAAGFSVQDIRELRIGRALPPFLRSVALVVYRTLARPAYFDSFHFLLRK